MDLKNSRKFLGLTQSELADKLKMSQSQICSIEMGRRKITDRFISQVAYTFGLSEEWIRTGDGDPYLGSGKENEEVKDNFLIEFERAYKKMDKEEKEAIKVFMRKFGITGDDDVNAEDEKKIM